MLCFTEFRAPSAPAALPPAEEQKKPLDVKLGCAVRLVQGHGKFSSPFITPMTVPSTPLCVLRVTLVGRLVLVRPGATASDRAAEVQRMCVAAACAAGGNVVQCMAVPGDERSAWVQLRSPWDACAVIKALWGVRGVRVQVSPYACVLGGEACVPEACGKAAPPLVLPCGEYVVRARGVPPSCTREQIESALGGVAVNRLALMPGKKGTQSAPQCCVVHIAPCTRAKRGTAGGMAGVVAAYQALHGTPQWMPARVHDVTGALDRQGVTFVTPFQGLRQQRGVKRGR